MVASAVRERARDMCLFQARVCGRGCVEARAGVSGGVIGDDCVGGGDGGGAQFRGLIGFLNLVVADF